MSESQWVFSSTLRVILQVRNGTKWMNILVNVQLKLMVKCFSVLEYFELLLSHEGFMSTKCICVFSFYFCYLFLTSMLNLEIKRVGRGQGILGCIWVRFFVVVFFLVIFTARLATFGPFLAKNTAKFVFRGRSDIVSLSLPL